MLPAARLRHPTPPGTFFRWIASLLGLAGLVLGIPVALVAFHVTPPLARLGQMVTHPSIAGHYLNSSLTDTAVAHVTASVAWMVWLWLVVCVGVEVVAAMRGRPAFRIPASRHVQSLATALVGASLTVLPLPRDGLPMRFEAAPVALHAQVGGGHSATRIEVASDTLDRPVVVLADRPEMVGKDGTYQATAATTYVVKPGDTLWSIAERELGSPLRWREIAALNYGRVQSGGSQLTDAHWIYPGWDLILPTMPDTRTSSVVVERLAVPETDPRRSTPEIRVQSAPGGPTVPASGKAEERNRTSSSGVGRLEPSGPEETASHGGRRIPAGAIAYGVLGAGVIALLERLRRVQRRHRPVGMRIALPNDDLVALERRLRLDSDPEGVDAIDLGLRALVVQSLRCDMTPPQAALVRLRDHALEIVLDAGSTNRVPPQPFTADSRATSWLLSRDLTTIQALREDQAIVQMDPPFPAMITVGRDEFGLALIDLEQAASIEVAGSNAEGTLRAIAVEMATAKWADQVEVILVGFDRDLDALERVNHVSAIADVIPKVQRRIRERSALLTSVGRSANWEIRWTEGGDAWDLCVVICARRAVDADRDNAIELVRIAASGGQGVAVVLASDASRARWHLNAEDGRIALRTAEMTSSFFGPHPVDSDVSQGIASLIDIAGQLDGVLPTDPPYDQLVEVPADSGSKGAICPVDTHAFPSDGSSTADASEHPDRDWEVLVRVLGPIEIEGASRTFSRAWALELIVYLAMHRKGASSDQWATALWPDRIMAAASLHSTASAARRSLGVSSSGDDHLPRAHGRLSLGPSVGSDWSQFADLAERPDPECWREALELIRGRPFEGLRSPDWVLLEGIAANIEAVVVDLASRYAEYRLSVGDPGGAEWSARQGLRVSAYDERLYRILLRAADVAGNPAGVESVMTELVRLVAEDVEPYDAVHPETLDLYRTLSRRSTPFANR